jgi:hypothetical protein
MFLHFILGAAAVLTGVVATVLAVLVLGIRRGDCDKRLTGEPGSGAKVLARRMLTGSRGCASRDNTEDSQ